MYIQYSTLFPYTRCEHIRVPRFSECLFHPARPVQPDLSDLLARPSCPMTTADDYDKEAHQVETWAAKLQPIAYVYMRPQTPYAPADTVGIAVQAVQFQLIRTLTACQLQRVGML